MLALLLMLTLMLWGCANPQGASKQEASESTSNSNSSSSETGST